MRARENQSWIQSPTAVRERLEFRAKLVGEIRRFFAERNYLEVQTPLLLPDVCIDAHIDPISLPVDRVIRSQGRGDQQRSAPAELYLQTSPEFAMKRLLAMGSGSIWQMTPAFRSGELGPLHNPEFTMLEWYMVGGSYHDLMSEVALLTGRILNASDLKLQVPKVFPRISYREAFLVHADFDPFEESDEELRLRCERLGFQAANVDRDGLLNFLLASLVEPKLGAAVPTFLYDFPASQCALAKVRRGDPDVAERFELYIHGAELCNGYQELTDAEELVRRNVRQNHLRQSAGKELLPIDSHLIEAMRKGMPECTGVALGFDRLLMMAQGHSNLQSFTPFHLANELAVTGELK